MHGSMLVRHILKLSTLEDFPLLVFSYELRREMNILEETISFRYYTIFQLLTAFSVNKTPAMAESSVKS